jgi:hypothetical protein
LVIDLTTDEGKAKYAAALLAATTKRPTDVIGTGVCASGAEKLAWIGIK